MSTRVDKLNNILGNLRASSPNIVGAAIVSIDGFVMASVLPSESDEDVISAMGAAMLGIGERIARELLRGEMEQLFVRGENGYVVLNAAGKEAILITLTNGKAKLGLVFLDSSRAAQEVAKVL
ncbi:MAG: roadblock/LC7 domain-containing protein [Deltaproteobacteria bacterium]|nr:roadblock/LC7 domain-containing protein [Deltaproteobacteria bacterium]